MSRAVSFRKNTFMTLSRGAHFTESEAEPCGYESAEARHETGKTYSKLISISLIIRGRESKARNEAHS